MLNEFIKTVHRSEIRVAFIVSFVLVNNGLQFVVERARSFWVEGMNHVPGCLVSRKCDKILETNLGHS